MSAALDSPISRGSIQTASLAEPQHQPPQPQNLAQWQPPAAPQAKPGFRLIPQAMADTLPRQTGGPASWAIQVGAYGNESMARAAAESARNKAQLAAARPMVGTVRQASATLYRARVTGLSHDAAIQACDKLGKAHGACIVLSPEAQS